MKRATYLLIYRPGRTMRRFLHWTLLADLTAAMSMLTPARATPAPSFTPIPSPANAPMGGVAQAVSADGTTVVGWTEGGFFRWTRAGGTEILGVEYLAPFSAAFDVSGDGSVVVGNRSRSNSPNAAFRWTAATGLAYLDPTGSANGVSRDGSIIVGSHGVGSFSSDDYYEEAFRWTAAQGVVPLPSLPGAAGIQRSWAGAVADDGTVVGASSTDSFSTPGVPVRWNADGTIGRLFQSGSLGVATDITPDGSVIVGAAEFAFRWTATGGPQLLGGYAGFNTVVAHGVSADGSVIVGEAEGHTSSRYDAFIWDPVHGTRSFKDVLTEMGLDLSGWSLTEAYGISADGFTIAGYGIGPGAPGWQPWVATLPEPAALPLLSVAGVLAARRRR